MVPVVPGDGVMGPFWGVKKNRLIRGQKKTLFVGNSMYKASILKLQSGWR